ncbi:MAG: DNRLRE domain-containing protein [Planctomycetes bacterium]|nr:DNRLRE domain-containing protein [Planctomycetota bacterium]
MKASSRFGRLRGAVCAATGLCFFASGELGADTLIAPASAWRYDDTGTDLGTAWGTAAFDDSSWASGPAQLGYGDGDEATVLSFGPDANDKHPTCYFRQAFSLPDPSAYQTYTVRFVRDDGLVIYANGQEAVRSNMPSGTIAYGTFASSAVGAPDESAWQELPLDAALLVPGDNLIAVEVHQANSTSSDLSFALELIGTPAPPPVPVVTLVSPPDQSTVNTTEVSFTVSATDAVGLLDATLYVGKAPRTVTFGPADSADAHFTADQPSTNFGSSTTLRIDGQTPHAHAVIKYPYMFGSGAGNVPPGSTISSATLEVSVSNAGNVMNVYRLTEDWIEADVTWSQRMAGVPWTSPGADGPYSNAGTALSGDCTATGLRTIDITQFVQEWSNGSPNYGIVLTDGGADGVEFSSSEGTTGPVLTVTYQTSWPPIETKPLSGTSAGVTFTTTLADQEQHAWNCLVTNTSGEQSWAPADFLLTVDTNAPDAPALVSPPDGATGQPLSPLLEVAVSDPNGDPLDVTFYGRPAAAPGDFTIIPMPDTQFYSQTYPQIYTAQTQWIADNVIARNIVFVTHEGDIVQTWDNTTEWQRADTSMSILDGVVPYGLAPGNHDEPTTYYNVYFPFTRYENEPWYGGHRSTTNDNNFQLFSAGGVDFLVVHLDFCPASDVIAWADSVLEAYPERKAIVTTHGYIDGSGNRGVHLCTSTQYIWDGLVVPNPNVHFVLCGHWSGEYARTDVANGHEVHQLLADYQSRTNGGDGWLRILRFAPAENRVYVQTYSPWLGQYETDSNSQFTLDFDMTQFSVIGTSAGVPSGSTASVSWPGLAANTEYEWYARATDPSGRSQTSAVGTFTTGSGDVDPPSISGVAALNVTATSATVVWSTDEPADSLVDYGLDATYGSQASDASLVTSHAVDLTGLSESTTYHYRVTSSDASGNSASSADITFTTLPPNVPPVAQDQSVTTAEDAAVAITLEASDPDGDPLTYSVIAGPANGALSGAAPDLTYTPAPDWNGSDSFTFRASDGQADSNVAVVSITVTPVTDAPVSSPQSVATPEDTPVAITLTATDADGDALTYTVVAGPANGVLCGTAPNLT